MPKILVVDDEKNIRITIKRCLESPEYSIDEAINGEEAITKLETSVYDLLLLDLKLPGVNGMEILKLVKEKFPSMKVVIISAHGTIQIAVESLKAGALDFLEKPFSPTDLRQAVIKALDI
jgi:DNA-binding NtrC family response regulator